MTVGITRCAVLALLILTVIPVLDARPPFVGGEVTRGPAMLRHNPSGSTSRDSVDIKRLSGDFRLVVILVEFTDIKHTKSRDTIDELVFGGMNKYWREVSYDQFNVIGDTVNWINLGHNEAYYGKDTDRKDPGSDQRDPELFADACRLAKGVDFNQYQDIMVVYAGHGQDSDSKDTNLLWPSAYMSELGVTCGGKTFDSGGSTPEINKDGGLAIGTFTHEFGHTIKLPDLYNTDPKAPDYWETGIDYVGLWSLMASGSWGGPDDDGSSPVGLESWSRIKLGWLSSASVPLSTDGFVQLINQLGDTKGPRALKTPATGSSYYLFEARAKFGVDKYLPDSGVLITRIDESKGSGHGIVKVMDCHPETKSIDDATCKVNESWSDTSNGVYVKVVGKQGTSYVVAFASKPITALNVYAAELLLAGLPSSVSANLTVDGTEYATISGSDRFKLFFPLGSTHTVTLPQYVMTSEDTRYYAAENTITITKEGIYSIEYVIQYRLLVEMEPPSITGAYVKWFTADESHTLGPYDEIVPVDSGTRYVFAGLTVDGTSRGKSVTLRMDQPHKVTVRYVTQYFLRTASDFGDPKGEGWYTEGDAAGYSVTTPDGFLIQHVFVSWTGDITSAEPRGVVTMTRPYAIKANWRDDYTQLMLVVAILAVVIVAVALKARKRREPPSPTIVQPESLGKTLQEAGPISGAPRWCISCGQQILQEGVYCEHCGAKQL